MKNVLILGANGQIARVATDLFLKRTDAHLTLYLRDAKRLRLSDYAERVRIVEGDVLDTRTLEAAMAGQDVVYVNLAGPLEQQARNIVNAMEKDGVRRLIFISSMGVYDEIPGERHHRFQKVNGIRLHGGCSICHQLSQQALSSLGKRRCRRHHRHGFYTTKWGKRRRYQSTCGETFCSTTGTPYYQPQQRRDTFDGRFSQCRRSQ